ncbi:MAG: hypothetical protein HQ582_17780 [Planctomycetes bacterium]|nr:hypothetical protein [Planctomycetota bacterium]
MNVPRASRVKRLDPLAGAALLVWLAWLVGSAVVWWQYRARVMHPHFFPLVPLMLVQVVAGGTAVCLGLWRLVRGPRRLAAASWTSAAVIPILLWLAHTSYVFGCLDRNMLPKNVATKTALVVGASLMDVEARFRYPRRLAGERVVMIYDRVDHPQKDVAAMDRHVAKLEHLLGRTLPGKIHWVRGNLLGFQGGRAFQGIAMCRPEARGPGRLSRLDRHEVAHIVLNQHLPPDANPPTVLIEGWAESQQGSSFESLARNLWKQRRRGLYPTFPKLVEPRKYSRTERSVYVYGAPLVDYLLREYGIEKFFELYSTCRQETFDEDCRRILGAGPDELHRRLLADVREQIFGPIESADESVSARLGLPERGPIDEAAREAFLSRYPEAARKLQAAYSNAHITAVIVGQRMDNADGEERPPNGKELEIIRTGSRARLVRRSQGYVLAWVATPETSFSVKKQPGDTAFDLRSYTSGSKAYYRDVLHSIQIQGHYFDAAYGIGGSYIVDRLDEPGFAVTGVVNSRKDGKPLVTVHYETLDRTEANEPVATAGWFSVCPDNCWAIDEYEVHWQRGEEPRTVSKARVEYGPKQHGVPLLRHVRVQTLQDDEQDIRTTTTVKTFDFGPVTDEEFQPAAFGVEPPREPVTPFTRAFHLTLWALGSVAVMLVVTVALQVVLRRIACSPLGCFT